MVPLAHPSHQPKRHLDRFSRFHMGPKCRAVQCIVSVEEKSQNCPSPWDFVTPPDEHRDTAIGNMLKNLVKIGRMFREICSRTDRQTHTHTNVLITILRQRSRKRSNKFGLDRDRHFYNLSTERIIFIKSVDFLQIENWRRIVPNIVMVQPFQGFLPPFSFCFPSLYPHLFPRPLKSI